MQRKAPPSSKHRRRAQGAYTQASRRTGLQAERGAQSRLLQLNPARDGGYAVVVGEKEHVPTGWRDVVILGNRGSYYAVSKARHIEINQSLAAIV